MSFLEIKIEEAAFVSEFEYCFNINVREQGPDRSSDLASRSHPDVGSLVVIRRNDGNTAQVDIRRGHSAMCLKRSSITMVTAYRALLRSVFVVGYTFVDRGPQQNQLITIFQYLIL